MKVISSAEDLTQKTNYVNVRQGTQKRMGSCLQTHPLCSLVSCYVIHGLLLNVENPLATRGRDTSINTVRHDFELVV